MRATPAPNREQSKRNVDDEALDRELNSLVREMKREEAVRRAVIDAAL